MKVEMRRLSVNDFDLLHNGCSEFPAGRMLDSLGITVGQRVEITRRNAALEEAVELAMRLLRQRDVIGYVDRAFFVLRAALPAEPAPPALEAVPCPPGLVDQVKGIIAILEAGK